MATIVLITGLRPSSQQQETAEQLLRQFNLRGNDVVLLTDGLWPNFFQCVTRRADVYDFHAAKQAILIPFIKFFHHKSTVVFTLHERADLSLHENIFGRALARLGTFAAVHFANHLIASQKILQYYIYQHHGVLPSYIPVGVTLPQKTLRQGKKNFTRYAVIADTKKFQAILRSFKSKRARFCLIEESKIGDQETLVTMQNTAALLLLKPITDFSALRKIALYGLPIIGTDTLEHREAFHTHANYLAAASGRNIQKALNGLKTNYPQYRFKAKTLQKFSVNLYNWENLAVEYLAVYQKSKLPVTSLDSVSKPETAG